MQHYWIMDYAEKVERIMELLRAREEPGSPTQVARLLDVSPSTVTRWIAGETRPPARQAERLDLLYRTLGHAEKGNDDANRILGALLGGAGGRLLGLGVAGILIAAGLGWLLGGDDHKNGG